MKKYKNENRRMRKIAVTGIVALIAVLSASALTGCQSASPNASVSETVQPATVETLGATDQAIVDAGLSVDSNGNVVDKNGNKVKQTSDGKVEVKTADGKTVTVDAVSVKTANENKAKVDQANAQAAEAQKAANNNGNTSGNNSGNAGSGNTQTSKNSSGNTSQTSKSAAGGNQTSQNTSGSSSQSSKASQTSTNTQTSQTSSGTSSQSSKSSEQSSKQQSSTADAHAGKTYHDNEYEYIKHPAETKQVKVVDQAAYSYEEPVYETQYKHLCWGCDADIATLDDWVAHMEQHHQNGEETGYRYEEVEVQVGTKTVNVPEKSHIETVTIKEEWTEKVLVKEAGWY